MWKHDMPCVSEKIILAEVSEYIRQHVNVINIVHKINSILYTVTSIEPKTGILLKVINVFHSRNLALFIVTNIHSTRRSAKNRNSETRWKVKIQGSNRSNDKDIELINLKVWRKIKKLCSVQEIDCYIMWK